MTNNNTLYSPEEVSDMLNMSGLIDERLIDIIALLPKSVVDFIESNCVILAILEGEGTHWNLDDDIFAHKKSLIIINSSVWDKTEQQIVFTVAHEVAHAYLGHKIKVDGKDLKQEKAADNQAIKWLSNYWTREELLKICNYLKE